MGTPKIVSVLGSKKSGKTTTTQNLISELTKRGYRVAAVKHVSEENFTIDAPGKDTWRFAQAGAKTIISVAANEIATIEKVPLEKLTLEMVFAKCAGNDIIVTEGLKKLLGKNENVPKIVVIKSAEEAKDAPALFKPILAFSGPYNPEELVLNIPYADALRSPEKLADIIERSLLKKTN
jgi:molybdopterin-guanine dinucleotide biosynthesis protein B